MEENVGLGMKRLLAHMKTFVFDSTKIDEAYVRMHYQ